MPGELLRQPFTYLLHGLEQLGTAIPDGDIVALWHRLRLDKEFRDSVARQIYAEDKRLAGEQYEIEVDYSLSRQQMIASINGTGFYTYVPKDELIEGLEPKTEHIGAGQLSIVPKLDTKTVEMFVVTPHRELSFDEAKQELRRRGLESVQTEEALSFYKKNRGPGKCEGIFILDARVEHAGELHCLSLTRGTIGLHPIKWGFYRSYGFLARQIKTA